MDKPDNTMEWELVAHYTHRLRVPGGWIYQVETDTSGIAITFVPDAE